jgi:type I restriction enzyme S subunit
VNLRVEIKPLGEIAQVLNGKTPSKADQRNAGHPVLKIKDVDENGVFRGPFESFVDKTYAESFSKKIVRPGDTLILNAAHNAEYVGSKSFFACGATEGALATGEWLIVRPDGKRIDARFIHYWLINGKTRRQIREFVKGIHLYPKDVARLEIPLPPLDEQRRIAAILDKADALRRKRRRALDLLDGLAQSVFLDMFGDPIENTKRLPVAHLEDVVSPTRKITYGILKPGPDQSGGIPYVRVVDIKNSQINVGGLKRTTVAIATEYKRSTLREGDLLISIRGHVGRMAITPLECDGANITQDTARLAITAANTEFVKAHLETDPAKHWMTQRTKGAAVKGINLGDLRRFPLILPPRQLQDEFAEKMRIARRVQDQCDTQNDNMEALFSSLQSRAFSGQL